MANAAEPPLVFHDVDWRAYTFLIRTFEKGGHRLRQTYDRGTLEILFPVWEHEAPAYLIGRFIDVLTEEYNLPCRAGGTVTLRLHRIKLGLEPDNCYWIASAQQLLGKTRLDLRTDPPPDLAIEIDVTHPSLDRMSIYAALQVPEVWHFSAAGLSFTVLQSRSYETRTHSLAFPQLASADVAGFLSQLGQIDDTMLARQFRAWVRQNLLKLP